MAMTAAMAAPNMQPIKMMTPDLLSTCAGARRTSCPAKRLAGADELVDTLVLPAAFLASSPSPALATCASQAACTRQSGSAGSVRAFMLGGDRPHWTVHLSLACRFLNCTRPCNDQTPTKLVATSNWARPKNSISGERQSSTSQWPIHIRKRLITLAYSGPHRITP
jgi:hypothetical protein